jgi:predicted transcriptional regulator
MLKPKKAPTPIYVRPTHDLRRQLDARAKQERRSVKAVVEAALFAYLKTDAGEVAR